MKPSETFNAKGGRADEDLPAAFCREYLGALRDADPPLANQTVADALDAGVSPAAVHSKILAPAMRQIGELWERGQISVGDEHVATAITQQVMVRILDRTRTSAFHSREPARVMFNFETTEVESEFKRIQALGAKVVAKPYHPGEAQSMLIATFADPDGNLFQLMTPWEEK
jgi:methanogenic corrinoid protein MtbC1